MGIKDILLNTATLGGHGRLQRARDIYNSRFSYYESTHKVACERNEQLKVILIEIGEETKLAFHVVSLAICFTRTTQLNNRVDQQHTNHQINTSLSQNAIANYSSTLTLTTGAGVSSVIAVGSWTAVSFLGTASTGTAIGTIYGAASTNATLAWFGGGSLAAGGGGMAAGMMTLGGLVIAPLVVFAAWSTHSKVPEVEEQTVKLNNEIYKLESKVYELNENIKNLKVKLVTLREQNSIVTKVYNLMISKLFPKLYFSFIYRYIRSYFGHPFYDSDELKVIMNLSLKMENFSRNFASNIVSSNSVCKNFNPRSSYVDISKILFWTTIRHHGVVLFILLLGFFFIFLWLFP